MKNIQFKTININIKGNETQQIISENNFELYTPTFLLLRINKSMFKDNQDYFAFLFPYQTLSPTTSTIKNTSIKKSQFSFIDDIHTFLYMFQENDDVNDFIASLSSKDIFHQFNKSMQHMHILESEREQFDYWKQIEQSHSISMKLQTKRIKMKHLEKELF